MGQTGKSSERGWSPCPSPPKPRRLGSSFIRCPKGAPERQTLWGPPDWCGGEGTADWAGTPVTELAFLGRCRH